MSAAAELSWTPQDTETELRLIFENAPLWFAQLRAPGTIAAWNPALERVLAFLDSKGPLSWPDLLDAPDRRTGEGLIREIFDGKRETIQFESRSSVDHKAMRWTLWRLPGAVDKPDSVLALAEEVHTNAEAEQRLRQAQKLEIMGRLASGMAHDFNNLLTGVLLYCDLLMNSLEPGHRARKYADEIRGAGLQAAGVVRQLLAVARPSIGGIHTLSLNQVAESLRNLLARLIGDNIELNLKLDEELGQVRIEETQAQQVILNLVLNARDAIPAGGAITVETSNCEIQVLVERSSQHRGATELPCALLVVSDNGIGIDESTRAHIFEPFFTTKGAKGTGLGLATVQDIVRSNGGLIHVRSAPGCGTRVSVLLPLVPDEVSSFEHIKNLPKTKEIQLRIHEGKTII